MNNKGELLNALIEVSHVEFQTYNMRLKQLMWTSGVAEKVLGYTDEHYKLLSENFYEHLVHPDDHGKIHDTVERLLKSAPGEIVETTLRYKRSNGDYLWMYTRKMVYRRDVNNKPSVIITIAENVTEMVEIIGQLQEKTNRLKAVSWKNSHELRAPAANIIGLLELIEEEHITSEHNLKVFICLKQTIEKLDKVILEINDAANG